MPKDTFFNLNGEKQEKVVRCAIAEFLTNGYEKGNIGAIAKNAGVAKGSMYQYFDNKQELFMYCVQWTVELMIHKVEVKVPPEGADLFDYFYMNARETVRQIGLEREPAMFVQKVFLGKICSFTDAPVAAMLKAADAYIYALIAEGKKNGSIRADVSDEMLALFMTGASMKIKERLLEKAADRGLDILGEDYALFDEDIRAMLELIKNGMGAK